MKRIYLALLLVPAFLLAACGGEPASTVTPAPALPTDTPLSAETPTAAPAKESSATPAASGGDLTATAKQFVDLLAKGDFATAESYFDPTMMQAMPQDKLAQTWQTLLGQVGEYKGQIGARTDKVQQYDVVYVTTQFDDADLDVQLTFDADGKIGGLFFRPASTGTLAATPSASPASSSSSSGEPAYVNHDAFTEQDVKVGSGEWELPGTLTMPKGDGPFPAVVLVQGSGPQDRDETTGSNKPFQDVAWGLASQGIAVLRYDKRTLTHGSQIDAANITLNEETVDDALSAAALLRTTDKVDKSKIFMLGHSLGGLAIPRIGTRDPDLAGFIVMAGPTRPFEDAILLQYNYVFNLQGTPTVRQQKQLDDLKAQADKVKSADLSKDTPSNELPLGIAAPYWLDLRGYKPAEVARSLKQPMLILQGEADYQVNMDDFQGWKDALQSRSNVEFKSYPGLYHLFMPAQGKMATPDDYKVAGHVEPQVVQDVGDWINARK